jgi:hypothetical protein
VLFREPHVGKFQCSQFVAIIHDIFPIFDQESQDILRFNITVSDGTIIGFLAWDRESGLASTIAAVQCVECICQTSELLKCLSNCGGVGRLLWSPFPKFLQIPSFSPRKHEVSSVASSYGRDALCDVDVLELIDVSQCSCFVFPGCIGLGFFFALQFDFFDRDLEIFSLLR